MRISNLVLLLFFVLSWKAGADVITHYMTKSFQAESVNVVTPKLIEVTAYMSGSREALSKLYIQTDGLIYDEGDQIACVQHFSTNCARLKAKLEASLVQFSLRDSIGKSAFNGVVYVNGENLRHTMLRDGWYKYDYKVSRSYYDILLQKEAECKRKGLWKHISYLPTDERCQ